MMSVREYIKVASGNYSSQLGVDGYKVFTPIIPSLEKILALPLSRVDRKKREYMYEIEKLAN